MNLRTQQQGITLIELLVSMAILGMVLAGVYGLLDTANRSYLRTRALVESQQAGRVVLNYLLLRLREIDGSGLVKDPRYCEDCHTSELDDNTTADDAGIPCTKDVRIPRRSAFIENLTTLPVAALTGVGSTYQNLSGSNSISFWADLLPVTGMPDEFTDSPSTGANSASRNGVWDLTSDADGDSKFDPEQDREVLYYDLNDNGVYDYYAEKWSFRLKTSVGHEYFQLVESLSFIHTTDKGGTIDVSAANTSSYSAYTDQPVAYGVTGLGINKIPRIYPEDYPEPKDTKLKATSCGMGSGDPDIDTCHGNQASSSWLNVYENETAFSYAQFDASHPWWNFKAFHIAIATVDPQGRKFMKLQQVVVPRNFEVNQQYYAQ